MLYILVIILLLIVYMSSLFRITLNLSTNLLNFEPSLISIFIINDIDINYSYDTIYSLYR
jgi:hypothetical protein